MTGASSHPELVDLIDGSIGELSLFHETFGYYGHGIGVGAAVLPRNWRSRLVKLQSENTSNEVGYCLSSLDLAYSKLAAGRSKDLEFVGALLKHGYITWNTLSQIAEEDPTRLPQAVADALLACMAGAVAEVIHGFPRDIADRSDACVTDDLRADSGTVRGGAAGVSYSWLGIAVQSNLL